MGEVWGTWCARGGAHIWQQHASDRSERIRADTRGAGVRKSRRRAGRNNRRDGPTGWRARSPPSSATARTGSAATSAAHTPARDDATGSHDHNRQPPRRAHDRATHPPTDPPPTQTNQHKTPRNTQNQKRKEKEKEPVNEQPVSRPGADHRSRLGGNRNGGDANVQAQHRRAAGGRRQRAWRAGDRGDQHGSPARRRPARRRRGGPPARQPSRWCGCGCRSR